MPHSSKLNSFSRETSCQHPWHKTMLPFSSSSSESQTTSHWATSSWQPNWRLDRSLEPVLWMYMHAPTLQMSPYSLPVKHIKGLHHTTSPGISHWVPVTTLLWNFCKGLMATDSVPRESTCQCYWISENPVAVWMTCWSSKQSSESCHSILKTLQCSVTEIKWFITTIIMDKLPS